MDLPIDITPRWRTRLNDLGRIEVSVVRTQVRIGRSRLLRPVALLVNHLGNGWLYPPLAAALWWYAPPQIGLVATSGAAAAGVAHLVYPRLKGWVARRRPCAVYADLPPLLPVLDAYSFPSGHCMTVTAVALPICAVLPAMLPIAIVFCALMGWARLVAAHHYPSDILAGIVIGAAVAAPIAYAVS